jgi:hypothetical protein
MLADRCEEGKHQWGRAHVKIGGKNVPDSADIFACINYDHGEICNTIKINNFIIHYRVKRKNVVKNRKICTYCKKENIRAMTFRPKESFKSVKFVLKCLTAGCNSYFFYDSKNKKFIPIHRFPSREFFG